MQLRHIFSVIGLMLLSLPAMAQQANITQNPPNYGSTNDGAGIQQTQTRNGGFRFQPQDGSGNDCSATHPCPTTASVTVSALTPYQRTALGYQQITLSGTAQALTVPSTATIADFIPSGTGGTAGPCLFYRDDGTNPTATVGMPLTVGQPYSNYTGSLSAIRFINATGASCVLNVSYYK